MSDYWLCLNCGKRWPEVSGRGYHEQPGVISGDNCWATNGAVAHRPVFMDAARRHMRGLRHSVERRNEATRLHREITRQLEVIATPRLFVRARPVSVEDDQ